MKKIIVFIILLFLTGCVVNNEQQETFVSAISENDCYICGSCAEDFPCCGQNNVGIISLNTFEVMPIYINNYDNNGALIEKNTGCLTTRSFKNQENGFFAYAFENPDRGYADISLVLNEDKKLNAENTAAFLCQSCLDAVVNDSCFGVGVINFSEREIRPFDEHFTGFWLGDYYINCNWKNSEKADILLFYCPLRYSK